MKSAAAWDLDWLPHALLVGSLTAIATFGLSDRASESRWFYWALRGVGGAAAYYAYREYRKRAPIPAEIYQQELRAELTASSAMQLAQIERQFQAEIVRLNQGAQALTLQLEEERRRFQVACWTKDQWAEQKGLEFEQSKQELQAAFDQAIAEAEENLEKGKAKAQADLDKERAELMEQLEILWNQLQNQAREEVQRLEADLNLHKQIIGDLQTALARANKVKVAAGVSRAEWIANQAIEIFWHYETQVDYSDSSTVEGRDYIWLQPRAIVESKKVKEICAVIADQIDGIEEVTAKVQGGVIQLELKTITDRKSTREREALTVEGFDYFKSAIGKSNHDMVTGGTGAGKSTLISNLIDAASSDLKEEIIKNRANWGIEIDPNVQVVISDPKFPRTQWYVNGQRVKPQYRGFDRWVDPDGVEHPSALDGYAAMDLEVRARLNRAQLADFYGRPSAERPILFVLDEAEEQIAQAKKEASEPVSFTTRVGRSELVRAIVIGQNCNPSAYGLQRPQLNNFTRWFLGDQIEFGIEQVCTTSVQKRKYRDELVRLQQIAKTDKSKEFFALVKFPNERAYFVYMPPPGYFASQTFKPADLDQAIDLEPLRFTEEDEQLANMSIEQLRAIAAETNLLDLDERQRLEAIWQKAEEVLPDHLRIIVDFAIQLEGQWVTVGKLRSGRSYFKEKDRVSEGEILEYFAELVRRGLGELSEDGRKYRYEKQ
jgi:ribosome-associated translation inhibitor RaiA